MKHLLILFFILISNIIYAKDSVLVVLEMKEKFVYTGKSVVRGVNLAKSSFSKLDVDVNFIETSDNLHEVTLKTQEAIKKFKPIAIIGAITSNVAFAVSELAESSKIPFITPYATNSKITKNKKYTFRTCFDDSFQAKALANFSKKKLKKDNALIIIKGSSAYSIGIGKDFSDAFNKLGGKSKILEVEAPNDISLNQLAEIKSKNYDLIFLPHYQMEATAFLSKLSQAVGPNADFLGPDSWAGGKIFRDIVAQSNFSGRKAFFSKHYSEKYNKVENKDFLKKLNELKKDKNENLYYIAATALGYDAGMLLFDSIKKNKTNLTQTIRENSIEGATGSIDFKNDGTPHKGLFVFEINQEDEKFYTFYGDKQ